MTIGRLNSGFSPSSFPDRFSSMDAGLAPTFRAGPAQDLGAANDAMDAQAQQLAALEQMVDQFNPVQELMQNVMSLFQQLLQPLIRRFMAEFQGTPGNGADAPLQIGRASCRERV